MPRSVVVANLAVVHCRWCRIVHDLAPKDSRVHQPVVTRLHAAADLALKDGVGILW